VQSEQRQ
jgi:hypothetical protein